MSFQPDMRKFRRQIVEDHAKLTQGTALKVFRGVILRSPVDKGTFRASWTFQEGSPDTSVAPVGTNSIPDAPVEFRPPDFPVYFVNNGQPYAEPLENGHSGQAPLGMVAVTVAQFQ